MKTKARPILHVRILAGDGTELADVDAASTADALAYFLRSRRIDLTATETSVADLASAETGRRPADTETIARTTREWDGRIAGELVAEVH